MADGTFSIDEAYGSADKPRLDDAPPPAGTFSMDEAYGSATGTFSMDEAYGDKPPSATTSFTRGAARGVAPALTGMAGMGAGAEIGAGLGALGGPAAPVTVPIGTVIGALAGGFGAAYLTSEEQDRLLGLLPDSVLSALGQSAAQKKADGEAHPIASAAGEMLPQILTMRPGATLAAREGASALEKLFSQPVVARGVGAGLGAGTEAAQEAAGDEPVSPGRVAVAAGYGALLNRPTALGTRLEQAGARLVPRAEASPAPPPATDRTAEEHPVPPGGTQSAPEPPPTAHEQPFQTGYDLESNTFGVRGPDGDFVKTGFPTSEAADAAAREHSGGDDAGLPDRADLRAADTLVDGQGHQEVPGEDEEATAEQPGGHGSDEESPADAEPDERSLPDDNGRGLSTERLYADMAVREASRLHDVELPPDVQTIARGMIMDGHDSMTVVRRLAGLPEPEKTVSPQAHDMDAAAHLVTDSGKENGREHLTAIDSDTGKQIAFESGSENDSIRASPELSKKLRDPENRIIVQHNHPEGMPIGGDDISSLSQAGAHWIVAHGHDGSMSAARLEPEAAKTIYSRGWQTGADILSRIYAAADGPVLRAVTALANDGKMNLEEGTRIYHELINRALDRAGLIKYVSTHTLGEMPEDVAGEALRGAKNSATSQAQLLGIKLKGKSYVSERADPAFAVSRNQGMDEISREIEVHQESGRVDETGDQARNSYDQPEEDGGRGTGGGEEPSRLAEPPHPDAFNIAPDAQQLQDETSRSIVDALAGDGGGKNTGTYDRALARMAVPAGGQFKNLNPAEKLSIFPHTLAKLDQMFGRLWAAWKSQDAATARSLHDWRKSIPTFLGLDDASRDRVYAALELNRINQTRIPEDVPVTVENKDTWFARKSKPGESYTLSPKETAAYHEMVKLGDKQWSTLMSAVSERMGGGGETDHNILAQRARDANARDRKSLGRVADMMHVMSRQRQQTYFPMMRFGDNFISVTPRGEAGNAGLGGAPRNAWFEMVEKPAMQDWVGASGEGAGTVGKAVADRVAELRKQFPADKFNIETGQVSRNPEALRRLNIPAVEKLMMLMESNVKHDLAEKAMRREGAATTKENVNAEAKADYARMWDTLMDTFRNQMYEEMKAGYRKRANVVPGYDSDFDRAVGVHMHSIARNAASMTHRDEIDGAYNDLQDHHPHEATRKYVENWYRYQHDPSTPLSRAANTSSQVGFAYALAGNPSSSFVFATHTPLAAVPNLSIGIGMKKAAGALMHSLGDAYRHASFNTKSGAHIDMDALAARLPPDEGAYLRSLMQEDRLHSLGTNDLRALNDRQSEVWGRMKGAFRRGMDIAVSNISVVDQANRAATALAFYRMAKDPAHMQAMADGWAGNQVFRQMVQREGLTPETVGKFGLTEAAFEWGKANQAPVMRGPMGTMMFSLHGFQTRFLSTSLKLMKNMGPHGKIAFAWMMAGLWAGAGAEGLPFTQDLENVLDKSWQALSGHDPMISYRIRAMLADAGFGKLGAEIVMRGPVGTLLGIDLASRIGFGDVLTREFTNVTSGADVLGTVPSILIGRMKAAYEREKSGQGALATAAELLPSGLRNPARAAVETEQGLRTQKGKTVTSAARISPADIARQGVGFRPLSQERDYEKKDYSYRARRAKGSVPHNAIP